MEENKTKAEQLSDLFAKQLVDYLIKIRFFNIKIRDWPLTAKYNLAKHMELI